MGLADAVATMPQLPGAGGAAPGMGPTAGAGAVELGAWADAGRGPRPLKETVQTVAQDVDALRKHVKAVRGCGVCLVRLVYTGHVRGNANDVGRRSTLYLGQELV